MPSGKVDVAVGDVLQRDPRRERRDRLEADDLLDGLRGEQRVAGQQLPLVGVLGEQPDRVGELALGRVDAADEHVEHEVEQLDVAEPVALLLGGDQGGDQVVAGVGAAAAEQLAGVGVELDDRLLDLRRAPRAPSSRTGAGSSATSPTGGRGPRSARPSRSRSPARVGLGERLDEVGAASRRRGRRGELCEDARAWPGRQRSTARGVKAGLTRPRSRRWSWPVDVEDVAADLLEQRAVVDPEDLGDLHPREREALAAQEELARLAVDRDAARAASWRASPAPASSAIAAWKRSPRSSGSR